MNGTRRVGTKTRRDTFAEAWEAPTLWKTGVPFRMRHASPPEIDATHRSPPPSILIATTDPPPVLPLEKPLPPLPDDSRPLDAGPNVSPTLSSRAPQPIRSRTLTLRSILRLGRRKKSRVNSTPKYTEQDILPSVPPEPLALQNLSSLRNIEASQHPKVSPPRPKSKSFLYEDKGTQTSPNLISFVYQTSLGERGGEKRLSQTQKVWFAKPSPSLKILKVRTPSWSPKGLWVRQAAPDYFSIPTQADQAFAADSKSSSEITPRETILKNPKSGVSASSPPSAPPSSKASQSSEDSGHTVGTYESRYSRHSRGEGSFFARPFIPQDFNSEPVLPPENMLGLPTAIRPPMRPQGQSQTISEGFTMRQGRPSIPMPFQKFSSFAAARDRKKRSSGDSGGASASLLRQEIKFPEKQPYAEGQPPPPDFFQMPLLTPQGESEFLSFIPEHLAGSPLCPASPKHKYKGADFCPWHGRREVPGITLEEATIAEYPPVIKIKKSNDEISDGNADGLALALEMTPANHSANSPECPANAGGERACCIYHGWARGTLTTTDSEDSVPTRRLLSV